MNTELAGLLRQAVICLDHFIAAEPRWSHRLNDSRVLVSRANAALARLDAAPNPEDQQASPGSNPDASSAAPRTDAEMSALIAECAKKAGFMPAPARESETDELRRVDEDKPPFIRLGNAYFLCDSLEKRLAAMKQERNDARAEADEQRAIALGKDRA